MTRRDPRNELRRVRAMLRRMSIRLSAIQIALDDELRESAHWPTWVPDPSAGPPALSPAARAELDAAIADIRRIRQSVERERDDERRLADDWRKRAELARDFPDPRYESSALIREQEHRRVAELLDRELGQIDGELVRLTPLATPISPAP